MVTIIFSQVKKKTDPPQKKKKLMVNAQFSSVSMENRQTVPCTEATTGSGKAVENMNERPRDRISLFHLVLLTTMQAVNHKGNYNGYILTVSCRINTEVEEREARKKALSSLI